MCLQQAIHYRGHKSKLYLYPTFRKVVVGDKFQKNVEKDLKKLCTMRKHGYEHRRKMCMEIMVIFA